MAGLKLTKEMEVKHIKAYKDSMIVVNLVNGEYEAKEESMRQYLKQVKSVVACFVSFILMQIPRYKNKQADTLSKMAFVAFTHLSKKVLVEVLAESSIGRDKVCRTEEEETSMDTIFRTSA